MKGRRPNPQTITQLADQLPPCVVYALAFKVDGVGKHRRRLTLPEISQRSGLSKRTVSRIASRRSFAGVTCAKVDAFYRGCGVNVMRPVDAWTFLRRMWRFKRQFFPWLPAAKRLWLERRMAVAVTPSENS